VRIGRRTVKLGLVVALGTLGVFCLSLPFKRGAFPPLVRGDTAPLIHADATSRFTGAQSCQPCHQEIYRTFVRTAHFKTSRRATDDSIKGSFAEGSNILRTHDANVYFKMEKRGDGFYQTAYQGLKSDSPIRPERFDLVTGSGRRGQTYLYWRGNRLYQLPVSYLTSSDRWVNSPGYVDGEVRFDRLIEPRCLECHATFFPVRRGPEYGRDYLLGVSCEKCHGPGSKHVEFQSAHPTEKSGAFIQNPRHFSRDRKIDGCALCHSGPLQPKKPAFSYQPGEPLDDYFTSGAAGAPMPDVHGNQVGLLRSSRCFIVSANMSCSTCHDVHKEEREVTLLARKCTQCHRPRDCRVVQRVGQRARDYCIECHMPKQPSQMISIDSAAGSVSPFLRTHAIRIYPKAADGVLERLSVQPR
jgi:hypothetical protein